ncbi:barstar family protein [Porticoccus sp. W117]|uniref:barstar family protein n=1 Tax=Porticoccus sp. W117 TaxID=3054777 RepID=UPI00259694CE|nr:barstar family protein [Porticoccus sp. W117]MDM3871678.1 barstar family protein [Porticoccus sp. W117]
MNCEVTIDGSNIRDWDSFHNEFQEKMGFFDGYGRNLDAWLDCMTDIFTRGQYESLCKFNLNQDDSFTMKIINGEKWMSQSKETLLAFMDCYEPLRESKDGHYGLSISRGI